MLVYLSTKCENEAFARDAPPSSFATWVFFSSKKRLSKSVATTGFCVAVKRKVATPPSIVASIPASDQDLLSPPLSPRAGGQTRAGVEKHHHDKWRKRKEKEEEGSVYFFSLLRGDNGGRGKEKETLPSFYQRPEITARGDMNAPSSSPPPPVTRSRPQLKADTKEEGEEATN